MQERVIEIGEVGGDYCPACKGWRELSYQGLNVWLCTTCSAVLRPERALLGYELQIVGRSCQGEACLSS